MKSVYRIFLLIILLTPLCRASHLKGGEIMASYVSGQTYNIKVRIYLDVQNGEGAASMTSVKVCMGDGQTMDLPRTSVTLPNGGPTVADYDGKYSFPSSGIFQISVALDNRTEGMLNLPNSMETPMFIWTVIDTQANNSTPVLPYLSFEAGVRQVFSADLKPTVADADSISVRVNRVSKGSPGTCGVRMPDHDYLFPNEISSTGTFKVDPTTKQLIWKAPEVVGSYLFAMAVEEWRNGVKISESYREGTIVVSDKPGPTVEIPPYESAEYGNPITSAPQVDSPEVSMAIEAYPVPTEDFVTVKAYSKTRSIIKLQLIDLNGRVIRETATPAPEILVQQQFDLRNLSPGMYLIRASNSVDSVSQKLVR